MASYGTTTKYALRKLLGASLVSEVDTGFASLADDIDGKMVGYSAGVLASRPTSTGGTPGIAGRRYRATDTGQEFIDTGTSWVEIAQKVSGYARIATIESTSSATPVNLATVGPSVTVVVPDLGGGVGYVELYAESAINVTTQPGVGHVTTYLDGLALTGGPALRGTASAIKTIASAPGSLLGLERQTAGWGGYAVVAVTPGSRTFSLRYSVVSGGGSVSFSSRALYARAVT